MKFCNFKSQLNISISLFFFFSTSLFAATSTPSVFLFGQELNFCASDNLKYCNKDKKQSGFDDTAKQSAIYRLSDEAMTRLNEYNWTEQPELKVQTISLLQQLKSKLNDEALTARQFVRTLRRESFTYLGESLKGRDIWSNLFEFEKQNLFDLLEQKQANKSGKRLKTLVDISQTDNQSARQAFKTFYRTASLIAGEKRQPKIAFVTGNNRDPYKEVDYFKALFEELGFEATWLPIDAAMQTALAGKEHDPQACNNLEQYQVTKLASYRRKVLYPDLYKKQQEICKQKEGLVDILKKSDALFVADGSTIQAFHTFFNAMGKKSAVLTKLEQMLAQNQIILGVAGNSINTLSHRATIFSGDGMQVLLNPSAYYASGSEACNLGLDCISLEVERNLGYISNSIFDIFPWGVIDTQVSSLARQPRLLKTAIESQNRFAFGLDKATSVAISITRSDKSELVEMEVIGKGGLWVFDTQNLELSEQSLLSNRFNSYYLTHQDTAILRNGNLSVDFASWKFTNSTQTKNPTVTSSQPFARYNFYKLNNMLCNTSATEAKGTGRIQDIDYTLLLKKNTASSARKGVFSLGQENITTCSFSGVSTELKILN